MQNKQIVVIMLAIICLSLLVTGIGIILKGETSHKKNIYPTKIENSNENKTIEQQKEKISAENNLTKIYPSWDKTYYALLQQIREEECIVVIQDMPRYAWCTNGV